MDDYTIHKDTCIDGNVYIGEETKISPYTHVEEGAVIGEKCTIGQGCHIGKDVRIGNECVLQSNVSVHTGIELKDKVYLGSSCVFANNTIPRAGKENGNEAYRATVIGEGATVGANSIIVSGHDIGEYAMVGAGSLVNAPVKPYAFVVGTPAAQVGWVCKCGATLTANLVCPRCGKKYRQEGGALVPER